MAGYLAQSKSINYSTDNKNSATSVTARTSHLCTTSFNRDRLNFVLGQKVSSCDPQSRTFQQTLVN